ncbi:MAG: hypothetical protein M3Q72_08170 [Actinomycetota bacterium]|nr:hypothetical protein [Actinomycetota bacterium]
MNKFKHFTAAAILAGAIAAPALPALGSPASAAGPLFTGGIVNVTVTNVANNILRDANVGLGVAAGVAANVCDLNVAAVIAEIRDDGTSSCTSTASGQTVDITQS